MKGVLPNSLQAILLRATVVAMAAGGVLVCDGLAPLDRGAGDALLRLGANWPPAAPAGEPDVVVVAVDPHSLRTFPEWPWPRHLYARAIERMAAAGPLAIAFDIDFSTPSEASEDAEFARAIERSGRVALAAFSQRQPLPGGGEIEIANIPIEPLLAASASLGSVLVPSDADGVVRRAPRTSQIAGRPTPSLARAARVIAQRAHNTSSRQTDALDRSRNAFPIDYRRARPPFPVISIADLIEGRFDAGDLKGRVVFVGATASEFQDLWTTPLGPAQAGVFIQATAFRTLAAEAAGEPICRRLATGSRLALAVLLSFGLALVGGLSGGRRLAGLVAAALGVLAACIAAALLGGWIVSPALPLAMIGAHYALGVESIRKRFFERLAASDSSLQTLAQVAETTTHAIGEPRAATGTLDRALSLLGQGVEASAVDLLRTDRSGRFEAESIRWRIGPGNAAAGTARHGSTAPADSVGDPKLARLALAERRTRVVRSALAANRPGHVIYTPIEVAGNPIGVLVVERVGRRELDESALRTIEAVGGQIALCAQNFRLLEDLRETFTNAMAAMAAAVEARDGYTDLHCKRLSTFSSLMAERLGLPSEQIEAIGLGALLHDVGKIGIRDAVLNKPGRFTPEERAEMERHPLIGAQIVGAVKGLDPTILHCVRHHHERWSGQGYPDGLAGEEIPLPARIVSVVDVWDALSSHRPYKPPHPQPRVLEMLAKMRGELLDPSIVDLFLRVLDEQGEDMLALIERDARERVR